MPIVCTDPQVSINRQLPGNGAGRPSNPRMRDHNEDATST